MGDPRRLRKHYSGPRHPWQAERLAEEKKIKWDFGLKTKSELWKFESKLKNITNQAKKLIALRTTQSGIEKEQLLKRLSRLGILKAGSTLGDVLSLTVHDVLNRRLQTVVHKKNLARTPKQARQYITHGHIMVAGKLVTTPSYVVPLDEEEQIVFVAKSSLANPDHPERSLPPKKKPTPEEEEARKNSRRGNQRQNRSRPRSRK